MKKKVAIIGAGGYVGSELLRLLLFHDGVEVTKAISLENIGENVAVVHKNLQNLTSLCFSNEPADKIAKEVDLILFALPHCLAMNMVPKAIGKAKIIDLSADYRIENPKTYEQFYKKHSSPQLIKEFIYGFPEFNKEEVKKAENIANPGCFPTGALLALMPLAKENMLTDHVIVDAKTGSSGSGVHPGLGTHHSERAEDFKAYKVLKHQHGPEIEQELKKANKKEFDFTFVTHSAPMIRGIFITAYVFLEKETTKEELEKIYKKYYEKEPFVRIVEQARSTVVKGTNFCDISIACQGKKAVITTAVDNLVKGAAGTAVQNMNLMLGFEETKGLMFPGTHP